MMFEMTDIADSQQKIKIISNGESISMSAQQWHKRAKGEWVFNQPFGEHGELDQYEVPLQFNRLPDNVIEVQDHYYGDDFQKGKKLFWEKVTKLWPPTEERINYFCWWKIPAEWVVTRDHLGNRIGYKFYTAFVLYKVEGNTLILYRTPLYDV